MNFPPNPRVFLPLSSSQWWLCLGSSGLHGKDQDDRNIMTTDRFTPTKLTSQFSEMYHRTVTKSSHECKGWEKNTPVSWSLPFARCLILRTASFVIMSENSKSIQPEKPDMSQQHWITASFFPLCQCRKRSLSVATLYNSRFLLKWKVNKFPNVGLIKSKEMIKFKPGWAL